MTVLAQTGATDWTRTAQQICVDALQHLNVLGTGETAKSADMQLALGALDVVLKELPLVGYAWPQFSEDVSLAWVSGQALSLPPDYYGYAVVRKTVNGQRQELQQIPHAAWVQMTDRDAAGEPSHFYIDPANVLYLYPTPSVDPGLSLQYQKIIPDASSTQETGLPQYWIGALGYGVASELTLKYGIPQATRVEIGQRWAAKLQRCLENSIGSEVISFEVRE